MGFDGMCGFSAVICVPWLCADFVPAKFESTAWCADSKALTAAKRAGLFKRMKACGRVGWIIKSISAAHISSSMLRRHPYSLNALSHDAAMELVQRALDMGVNVTHVYVDTVGDPGRYQSKLSAAFAHRIGFTVEKKADATYKVVSAASIAAKVTRDAAMEVLQEAYQAQASARHDHSAAGRAMGSGYPGDATTKAWLEAQVQPLFGFDRSIRFSWSTVVDLLQKKGTRVQWEEEEDGVGAPVAAAGGGLTSFFTPSSKPRRAAGGGIKRRRSAFARRRHFKVVAHFVQDVTDGHSTAGGSVSGATPGMTPLSTAAGGVKRPRTDDLSDADASQGAAVAAAIQDS